MIRTLVTSIFCMLFVVSCTTWKSQNTTLNSNPISHQRRVATFNPSEDRSADEKNLENYYFTFNSDITFPAGYSSSSQIEGKDFTGNCYLTADQGRDDQNLKLSASRQRLFKPKESPYMLIRTKQEGILAAGEEADFSYGPLGAREGYDAKSTITLSQVDKANNGNEIAVYDLTCENSDTSKSSYDLLIRFFSKLTTSAKLVQTQVKPVTTYPTVEKDK
jgi:hypothetical protein